MAGNRSHLPPLSHGQYPSPTALVTTSDTSASRQPLPRDARYQGSFGTGTLGASAPQVGPDGQSQRPDVQQSKSWAMNPSVPPDMLEALQTLQRWVSATDLHAFLRPSGTLSRQQIQEREGVRQRYTDAWRDVLRQYYADVDESSKRADRIVSDFRASQGQEPVDETIMCSKATLEASRACRMRADVSRALDDWSDRMEDFDRQFEPPFTAYSYESEFSAPTAPPSGRSFDGLDELDNELDMQVVPYGRDSSGGGAAGTSSWARYGHRGA